MATVRGDDGASDTAHGLDVSPVTGSTMTARNRCNMNRLELADPDTAKSFDAHTTLQIIDGYWEMPPYVPTEFPKEYPPKAPLLDQPQNSEVNDALQTAFTHNNVTHVVPGTTSSIVMELFGDKAMAYLISKFLIGKISADPVGGIYRKLDHCGYSVSSVHLACHQR
jgi:hypothetical protein